MTGIKSMDPPEGKHKVQVKVRDVPYEIHREIKSRAAKKGWKLNDYIIEVLKQHVEKEK